MPGVIVEAWLARRSARAFNALFPEATPERALALKMLSQMRTFRRKAESALSNALEALSPADAVVRHKVDPEGEVQAALVSLGPAPPTSAQPPPLAAGQGPPAVRSGGAYDYIPLEPRSPGEQVIGPAAAERPAAWLPLEPRTEPHEETQN